MPSDVQSFHQLIILIKNAFSWHILYQQVAFGVDTHSIGTLSISIKKNMSEITWVDDSVPLFIWKSEFQNRFWTLEYETIVSLVLLLLYNDSGTGFLFPHFIGSRTTIHYSARSERKQK